MVNVPAMQLAKIATVLLAWSLAAGPARAEPARIGVVAPLSGPSEMLGKQVVEGARAAAGDAALEIVDDACSSEGGADAARRLVEAKVKIVVGFLCTEAIEAALPILKDAHIPVITPGVRTDSLTDRTRQDGLAGLPARAPRRRGGRSLRFAARAALARQPFRGGR